MDSKPFWQSRGFWTSVFAIVANILALAGTFRAELTPETQAQVMAALNSGLAVLAIVFRWQADGPLGGA